MARDLAKAAIVTLASASGFDDIEDDTRYFLRKVTSITRQSPPSCNNITNHVIR